MHDSFLNQIGLNQVSEGIIGCLASLFNDHAVFYRMRNRAKVIGEELAKDAAQDIQEL